MHFISTALKDIQYLWTLLCESVVYVHSLQHWFGHNYCIVIFYWSLLYSIIIIEVLALRLQTDCVGIRLRISIMCSFSMLCSSLVIVESSNDHCLRGISYNTNMIIKWFKLFERGVIFLNQFNASNISFTPIHL